MHSIGVIQIRISDLRSFLSCTHSCSASKDPTNPPGEKIYQLIWCNMIWVILDNWSWFVSFPSSNVTEPLWLTMQCNRQYVLQSVHVGADKMSLVDILEIKLLYFASITLRSVEDKNLFTKHICYLGMLTGIPPHHKLI